MMVIFGYTLVKQDIISRRESKILQLRKRAERRAERIDKLIKKNKNLSRLCGIQKNIIKKLKEEI